MEHATPELDPSLERLPNPELTMRELLSIQSKLAFEYAKTSSKKMAAVGALATASAIVSYPLAHELGIEHATIEADIMNAPAELRLTGNGQSSLQLGAIGSFYVPRHENGVGITAVVKDAPVIGSGNTQEYFTSEFRDLATNLFHDPNTAVTGYADLLKADAKDNVLEYLKIGTLFGTALVLAPLAMRKDWRQTIANHKRITAVIGVGLTAGGYMASDMLADEQREDWAASSPSATTPYPIKNLTNTPLEGTVASNPTLQLATNEAVPAFKKNIARQEAATNLFVETATASLATQESFMTAPRSGEMVHMALADTHGNQAMLQVLKVLHDNYNLRFPDNVISLITVAGDITTNGTAAEKDLIEDVVRIGYGPDGQRGEDDTPVVGISGDHERPISVTQMLDAGIINPDLETIESQGLRILGANDTAQKDFGGSKITDDPGITTQEELGQEVREQADLSQPDIVLLHEAYAAMSFLGIDDEVKTQIEMTDFLSDNGIDNAYLTQYRDDGIPNIPAGRVQYGHWHRDAPVRVLWNEDPKTGSITWTTVEELDTSTGSVSDPTINRFSLPWYPPLQDAVVRLDFTNQETGLSTGYQLYTFNTNGSLTIAPRVDVGLPGGEPGYSAVVKDGGDEITSYENTPLRSMSQ